eukprot:CAMPEP_0201122664 /NCGR_PEP_ID=MMETSP0850-20130426/6234_1 /ASSEMBLY_ACC=CAM_ASM_000622 /TAXON_ID=183588 /ORGANISM="Pseudo-nitzschia fraudulenta, Strain WWA7" /LENGTH=69 /DNA_ID=CAMNT_0047389397 /DNA_START=122 /DNA_END=331 /DNA_ORIENTATION=+
MISVRKSLLVLAIAATAIAGSEAKFIDAMLDLFDAPSRVDTFATAPGHFAEKTVEFLAFGDAAMDYYQS